MPSPSYSTRWSTLSVCAAGALAALIGYGVARRLAPGSVDSNGSTRPRSATVAVQKAPQAGHPPAPGWNDGWRRVSAAANNPKRTRELEAMLEELARTDPARALALALAEGNWLTRDQLRNAALRGWGAVAPDAAADWAMGQPLLGERMQCVRAVLTGAVEHPDEAVRVGLRLCAADPTPGGDYGHALINALVDKAGAFETAVRFATAATMVDRQSYLLDSAYFQWAQHEPERALADLIKITDPNVRSSALKGMIQGWADADALNLADFAQTLPPGEDRSQALGIALPQWVSKDPAAALQWINRTDPHPDYDKGIAAIALVPSLLQRQPELAMELTDSICDSARRTLTKSNVFFQWAQRDVAAARAFAESTQNPEYREMLLEDLAAVVASKRE